MENRAWKDISECAETNEEMNEIEVGVYAQMTGWWNAVIQKPHQQSLRPGEKMIEHSYFREAHTLTTNCNLTRVQQGIKNNFTYKWFNFVLLPGIINMILQMKFYFSLGQLINVLMYSLDFQREIIKGILSRRQQKEFIIFSRQLTFNWSLDYFSIG